MDSEASKQLAAMLERMPPATRAPKDCPHEEFAVSAAVGRILDAAAFIAEIRIICVHCREPFRFKGLSAGINFEHPTVSIDGLELHAPIEPEIETRLMASATYTVPKIPTRQ